MKQHIEQLIAQNQLEQAIKQLFELFNACRKQPIGDDLHDNYNMLITESGKLQGVLQDQRTGIIRIDDANLYKNQIRNSLLAQVNMLPAAFFEVEESNKPNKPQTVDDLSLRDLVLRSQNKTYEYDIFLSFSSKDVDWVKPICDKLRGYGLRVFFSDDSVRRKIGVAFMATISKALLSSKNFVLVCTPNAMESQYVEDEYETFYQQCAMQDRANRLFVIYAGATDFTIDLVPAIFRRFQFASSVLELVDAFVDKQNLASPVEMHGNASPATAAQIINPNPPSTPLNETDDLIKRELLAKAKAEKMLQEKNEQVIQVAKRKEEERLQKIKDDEQKKQQAELDLWETCCQTDTLKAYQTYLKQYPTGKFTQQALQLANSLKQQEPDKKTLPRKPIYIGIAALAVIFLSVWIWKSMPQVETRHEARLTQDTQIKPDTAKNKKGATTINPAQLKAIGATVNPTNSNLKTGTFTDPRDGHVYKRVKIGTQTWLAENLAYKATKGCWAYDNNESNAKKYGYLYDWETAKTVAPKGWHLPSDDEWDILTKYIESQMGKDGIGKYLKSISGWKSNGGGPDYFGFGGLPAGYRDSGGRFGGLFDQGFWWSSSENFDNKAFNYDLSWRADGWYKNKNSKLCGFSLRALRD